MHVPGRDNLIGELSFEDTVREVRIGGCPPIEAVPGGSSSVLQDTVSRVLFGRVGIRTILNTLSE